jgi:hydroxymethylbilane synthase
MFKSAAVAVACLGTAHAFIAGAPLAPVSSVRASASSLRMAGDAVVTIGTRGSPLALAQAYETRRLLSENFPELAKEGAVAIQVSTATPTPISYTAML